jgi:hypothetical protein
MSVLCGEWAARACDERRTCRMAAYTPTRHAGTSRCPPRLTATASSTSPLWRASSTPSSVRHTLAYQTYPYTHTHTHMHTHARVWWMRARGADRGLLAEMRARAGTGTARHASWPYMQRATSTYTHTHTRVWHMYGMPLMCVRHTSAASVPRPPRAGTQWHPEKPPYEFGMEEVRPVACITRTRTYTGHAHTHTRVWFLTSTHPQVPHSLDAIRVSQHLSNVFMDAARQSSHK